MEVPPDYHQRIPHPQKLAEALRQIVGEAWVGDQIRLPGSRRRWDMGFRQDGSMVLVEYDGDGHYRDSVKICADRERDQIAKDNGMRVIHSCVAILSRRGTMKRCVKVWQIAETAHRHWIYRALCGATSASVGLSPRASST